MENTNYDKLLDEANELANRPVEVITTRNGKFIVEWFNFNTPPPPAGDTKEEALEGFIKFIKENTDGTNDTGDEESRKEIESTSSSEG